MEPRPPKRPKTTSSSSTRGYPSQTRQWDDQSGAHQPSHASPTGQYQTEGGVYRPPLDAPESYSGVDFPLAPRSQRGHRWLGLILAGLLIAAIVGGAAWALTKALDGDDNRDEIAAIGTPPNPTVTQEAVAPTLPSAPTATEESETTEEAGPTETAPVEDEGGAEPTTEDQANVAAATEPQSAADYIPEASVIGPTFAETSEGGERTEEEVAVSIAADEATGLALLDEWGWLENPYQSYEVAADQIDPESAKFVSVSVHQFETEEGAAAAMQYLSDVVVSSQGLQDADPPAVGDDARALAGTGNSVNLYVLYVRDGSYLIRLGGAADAGDPSVVVNALALELIG